MGVVAAFLFTNSKPSLPSYNLALPPFTLEPAVMNRRHTQCVCVGGGGWGVLFFLPLFLKLYGMYIYNFTYKLYFIQIGNHSCSEFENVSYSL